MAKAKSTKTTAIEKQAQARIFEVRGRQVVLDSDLADFYGVETRRLMQQVSRSPDRFPEDFAFRLSKEEIEALDDQSQNVINPLTGRMRRGRSYPMVFTEHGALAAAGVLRTKRAAEVSIALTRAFVALRRQVAAIEETSPGVVELAEVVAAIKRDVDRLKSKADKQSEFQKRVLDALAHMQPFLEAVEEEETGAKKRLPRGST